LLSISLAGGSGGSSLYGVSGCHVAMFKNPQNLKMFEVYVYGVYISRKYV
jgi:hypothetical protein